MYLVWIFFFFLMPKEEGLSEYEGVFLIPQICEGKSSTNIIKNKLSNLFMMSIFISTFLKLVNEGYNCQFVWLNTSSPLVNF